MNESQPDATRALSLFRKLSKGGNQTAEETHELVELIVSMASSNLVSQLGAKIDELNEKLVSLEKSQTATYIGLIWAVGFASLIISAAIIFGG